MTLKIQKITLTGPGPLGPRLILEAERIFRAEQEKHFGGRRRRFGSQLPDKDDWPL